MIPAAAPRIDRWADLDGPVHYADFGGAGPPIVLVHGLGGSHLNWLAVAPGLARHGRVLALDLAGHGRTPSLGRARVGANRRLLSRFVREVAGAPAVLVGNSMGGTLALLAAAAEPDAVRALVLVNPAVPVSRRGGLDRRVAARFAGLALPILGEALLRARARHGPEHVVRELLTLCCVDAGRVRRDVYAEHVALATERTGLGRRAHLDFLTAQRSLVGRLLRRRRFFRALGTLRAPTLVVQGDRDRLVRLATARGLAAARPDFRLEVIEGVGHVPMLEAPERFLAVVDPWLCLHAGQASSR